jgi:hypothetical protein
MSETATEHLPEHLVFTTLVGDPEAASQPIDHVPDEAQPHVPTDIPPPVTLPDAAGHMSETATEHLPEHLVFTTLVGDPEAASQPIDHVPDEGQPHVPTDIPPLVTLPDAAGHMSETAMEHLSDFLVSNTAFVAGAGSQPVDHVPDKAAAHVPELVPPDVTSPGSAVDHMSDVAKVHLALHADWFVKPPAMFLIQGWLDGELSGLFVWSRCRPRRHHSDPVPRLYRPRGLLGFPQALWARSPDFGPAGGWLRVPVYSGCPLIHLASAVLSFAECQGLIPRAV